MTMFIAAALTATLAALWLLTEWIHDMRCLRHDRRLPAKFWGDDE